MMKIENWGMEYEVKVNKTKYTDGNLAIQLSIQTTCQMQKSLLGSMGLENILGHSA